MGVLWVWVERLAGGCWRAGGWARCESVGGWKLVGKWPQTGVGREGA